MRLAYLLSTCASFVALVGCDQANNVLVNLSPEVVSSLDGIASVRATVMSDAEPMPEQAVTLTVSYVDRHGTSHDIAAQTGITDSRGAFEATVAGLDWDGTGTVTVAVTGEVDVAGTAPFSVIDRTPPTVSIVPPTASRHVIQGQDFMVPVQVQDEIGVSQVVLEAAGELDRTRSSVVASGATNATVDFELSVPDNATVGGTITLYALAGDLSGNLSAAAPVVLTVDPRP